MTARFLSLLALGAALAGPVSFAATGSTVRGHSDSYPKQTQDQANEQLMKAEERRARRAAKRLATWTGRRR